VRSTRPKNILACSSSATVGSLISSALKSSSIKIIIEQDENSAIDLIKKREIDLLIMLTGFSETGDADYARKILSKSSGKRIPLVALLDDSASDYKDVKELSDLTLDIPFNEKDLRHAVEDVLKNQRKRVLFVDDSAVMRKTLSPWIEEQYQVRTAGDGQEALAILGEEEFDLVLTDIEMPVVDGYELCKTIRETPGLDHLPIIFLSGLGQGIDIEKGFEAGANDYISKPVDREELLRRIDTTFKTTTDVKREKVLVIDDSSVVRKMIDQALSSQGFTVLTAVDGEQGLEVAAKELPDLIITDAIMPGIDGFEVCRRLKADPELSEIPIAFLSAKESKGAQLRGLATGASIYITKPFQMDKLIVMIERLLAELRLKREASKIRSIFGRYQSEEVMESILKDPDSLQMGGERRRIVIMFTDLRGFTALSESLEPEVVVEMINFYFENMVDLVAKHEGIVNEIMGDGMVIFFGAPNRIDDCAGKAVACAVEMQLKMESVNRKYIEQGLPSLEMGVGINFGEVIVGNIGSAKRTKYAAVGNDVNLASRIESFTTGGQIMTSQSVVDELEGLLRIDQSLEIEAKGIAKPVTIYRIGGIGGDYGLYLPELHDEIFAIGEGLPLSLVSFGENKSAGKRKHATLVGVGSRIAEIVVAHHLKPLSTIRLNITDRKLGILSEKDLYAKVIRPLDDGKGTYLINFTRVPIEITEYFQQLISSTNND
jgi:adenylate cyclase